MPKKINAKEIAEIFSSFFTFRDDYTKGHCVAVGHIAAKVGATLLPRLKEFSTKEDRAKERILKQLYPAGCLHDLGKITWTDFLLKGTATTSEFSPEHWSMIKNHPEIAGQLFWQIFSPALKPSDRLWIILIWTHHWKYKTDGTDYPPILSPRPFIKQVIASLSITDDEWDLLRGAMQFADCFHAAISNRPYRQRELTKERTTNEVLADIMKRHSDSNLALYHPAIIKSLTEEKEIPDFLSEHFGR